MNNNINTSDVLLPTSEIITRAIARGVNFGKGDPNNRIRYYTKIGLLPHALRKETTSSRMERKSRQIKAGSTVTPITEGHYPASVIDQLVTIDKKLKNGKSIQTIVREMAEKTTKDTTPIIPKPYASPIQPPAITTDAPSFVPSLNEESPLTTQHLWENTSDHVVVPLVYNNEPNKETEARADAQNEPEDRDIIREKGYFPSAGTNQPRFPAAVKTIVRYNRPFLSALTLSLIALVFIARYPFSYFQTAHQPTTAISAQTPLIDKVKASDTADTSLKNVLAETTGTLDDVTINANTTIVGKLTAPNILYGLVAGNNITISSGQTPTISANFIQNDTLATVTARGSTTATPLILNGGVTTTNLHVTGTATLDGNVTLSNALNLGNLASDPSSATNGATYYNTGTNKFRCYQNGSWTNCITASGGSMSSFTVSDGTNSFGISDANTFSLLAGTGITLNTDTTNKKITVNSTATGGVSSLNSLTGALTIAGGGINSVSASGTTITITGTEADTLSSVTGRGATTSTTVALNGGFTSTSATPITLSSTSPSISIGNTGTLSITDGTNTLLSLADNGTTGTLTVANATLTNLATGSGSAVCINGSNQLVSCTTGSGGVSGNGTSGQIAFFNGATSITSESSGFGWDTTNKLLTVTSATATGNAIALTDSSLTTGAALNVTATSSPTTAASTSQGVQLNLTESAATNATTYNGLDIKFTNNPTVAGNTENVVRIQNQVTSNTTDNATAALLLLDNADTSVTGSTVVTDALRITNTGGIVNGVTNGITFASANIANGLNFSSTPSTNYVSGTNWTITAAGAETLGSSLTAVGVNSGSGLLQGTGGLTVTGTANINASGSGATNLGTGTGNVSIGNGTGTVAITSNAGLNVSTNGALTGVASLDTIATSATALTFAGVGTISSTTSSAITLDSGTTGNVNLGTGNNAKTINIGTGTAGNTINIATDNTTADAINIGSAKDTTIITGATTLTLGTSNLTVTGLTSSSGNALCVDGSNHVVTCTGGVGSGGISGSGTSGQIAFFNGASSITSETTGFAWDSTNKRLGIGTNSPAGLLDISKSLSGAGTLTGPYLSLSNSTYTASSNADMAFNSIATPTLAASGSQTTTNAYTLYIAGAPSQGTNETITNAYALGVNGNSKIVGTLTGLTGLTSSGTITFSSLSNASGSTVCINGSNQLVTCTGGVGSGGISGSGTSGQIAFFNGSGTITSETSGFGWDTTNKLFTETSTTATGTAASLTDNSLTTGTLESLSSTANGYTTGSLLSASLAPTAATGTSVSGNVASVAFSPTYSTPITTPTISGDVLNISRAATTNASFASTLTLSGAVAAISDNCTQTTGTCTDTSNVLSLSQNYASATGAVLSIANLAASNDINIPTLINSQRGLNVVGSTSAASDSYYGHYNTLTYSSGSNNPNVIAGLRNDLSAQTQAVGTAGTNGLYGVYNSLTFTGVSAMYGTYNLINSAAVTNTTGYGNYTDFGTSTATNSNGYGMYVNSAPASQVVATRYGLYNNVSHTSTFFGVRNVATAQDASTTLVGMQNDFTENTSNNSALTGLGNTFTSNRGYSMWGVNNTITESGSFDQGTWGVKNTLTAESAIKGIDNELSVTGDATPASSYGVYTNITQTGSNSTTYGEYITENGSTTHGTLYGLHIDLNGSNTAVTRKLLDLSVPTLLASGDAATMTFGDTSSSATTINGLNLTATINTTAAGAKVINGYVASSPTITGCATGACTYSAFQANTTALTQTSTNTFTFNGFNLATAGALVQNTAAGTINWTGANIQMPNITQTTGTVTSTGLNITGGTVTSGTAYAITTSASAGDSGFGLTTPAAQIDVLAQTSTVGLNLAGSALTSVSGNGTNASNILTVLGATGQASSGTTPNTAGAGGPLSLTGGSGGAETGGSGTNTGGAGGALTLAGGTGGNTTSGNGGAGGAISITAGNAGTGGNANGGTLTLNSGAITGTGTSTINLGSSNTTTLNIGRSGETITITGPSSGSGNALCLSGTTLVTCTVGSGGISGSGTSGQIAFFNGANSITSESSGFGWDTTNKLFTLTSTTATGTAATLTDNSLTTGTLDSLTSSANGFTTGSLENIALTQAAATGTSVSGNIDSMAFSPTYSTAITTPTISGDVLNISRAATTNASFVSTLTLSGAVASISDNCTQTTGTCTDTANVLSLTQSYSSATGAVLNISDSGTGSAISATGNSIASGTGISGTFNGLTTGTGLSLSSTSSSYTSGSLESLSLTLAAPTSGNTVNGLSIATTDNAANSSGNSIANGLKIDASYNTSNAAGTKEVNGISIVSNTQGCSGGSGSCTWSGLKIAVPTKTVGTTYYGIQGIGNTFMTTDSMLSLTGQSYAHTATEAGNTATISFTDATSANTASIASITTGLNIASTVNVTGGASSSGTKTIDALNIASPTLTACSGGSNACIWNGSLITTQSTGAASTITQNGLNIQSAGISAGSLNGINISGITAGAGTQNAISIGTGWNNFISATNFNVNGNGDLTGAITNAVGSTTANGSGASSTTLILTSAASFTVGNYVKVAASVCIANPCYAKITAKVSNTLTISPALSWSNGDAVTEVHVPEIGATDTASTLANRYGEGYFINGIATGNGTTYYTDKNIQIPNNATFTFTNASGNTIFNITDTGSSTVNLANINNLTAGGTITLTGLGSNSGTALCLNSNIVGTCSGGSNLTGSGTSGQIAFFNGANSLTSESSGFGWDTTNKLFTVTSTTATGTANTLTANSLTTGTDLLVTSSGTITGSGKLVSLVADSATTGTVLNVSGNGLTTGTGLNVTSSGTITGAGSVASFTGSGLTTGTGILGTFNALTSGYGMYLSSTSTSTSFGTGANGGGLAALNWNPGSSTTTTGDVMSVNVGANGIVGNIANFKNNGTSVFGIGQAAVTESVPLNVTAPGDVAIAYDINFTNPTASYIKSQAPLYIQSGETFNSSDLNFTTFNEGDFVFNSAAATSNAFNLNANSLTTGTGLYVNSTGTITSGGQLASFVADSATTGKIVNISGAGITSGTGIAAAFNGLTTGTGLSLTSSGTITSGGTLATLTANSATSGTVLGVTGNGLTTGTGILGTFNGLTTGTGISDTSSSNGYTTGSLLALTVNPAAATGTSVSGNIASVTFNPTYSTAITTPAITGNLLNISRAATTNASFVSTLTLSGAVASISDNCTQTTGTCTDTANVLKLTQSYATASGDVLALINSGTGNALSVNDGSNTNATLTKSGVLTLGKASTTTGSLVLASSAAAGTTTVNIGNQGGTSLTVTLPTAVGSTGNCLTTTVSGSTDTTSWASCSAAGSVTASGASSGQVAYFTGSSTLSSSGNFTWDNSNTLFGVTSTTATGTATTITANSLTTGTGLLVTSSGTITGVGTVETLTASGLTTGTTLSLASNAITTGTGISDTSSSNGYTTGSLLALTLNPAAATGTSVSGNVASVAFSPTYSTAITTPTISGDVLNISRAATTNASFASTLTLSGAVAAISDNCTQTTGTCTDTANVLSLTQSYASASGSVLNVSDSGTGSAIAATGNSIGSGTGISGTFNGLTTGKGLSITSSGTITTGGALVNFVADSATTGQIVNISGNGITTGTGINAAFNGLTGGTGINAFSQSNNFAGGSLISLSVTPSAAATSITGNIASVSLSPTYSTAITTPSITGSVLNIFRAATTNASFASTLTVSGAVAAISDNCTQTTGTCTDNANVLSLTQSYASASGTVLNISDSGTGLAILATANNISSGIGIQASFNGLTSGTGLLLTSSGTITGVGILASLSATGLTTGTNLSVASNALTTGTGISDTSTSNGYTTGSLLALTLNPAAATGTSVSGNIASVAFSPTYSTAITTPAISGDVLKISRAATTNASFVSTLTLSGAVAAISDNCTQTTGTCTDTANVLSLTQSYASASGAVLSISDSGTGSAISATGNSIGSGTGISGTFNGLTTGIGLSVTSSGTITSGGDLVNFVADSATTGTIVNISGAGINTGMGISATFNGLTSGNGFNLSSSGTIIGVGNLAAITASGLTTGTTLNVKSNALTTGTGISDTSSSNGFTTGSLLSVTANPGALTGTNISGNLASLSFSPTYSTAVTTPNITGTMVNIARSATTNSSFVSTLTVSGQVVSISDNCTQTTGTCTDSAVTLGLTQNYAAATGTVLSIINSGTGSDIAASAPNITSGFGIQANFNGLTNGTGLALSSSGTITSGGYLANLTANSLTTGTVLNLSDNGLTTGSGIAETSSSNGYTLGSLLSLTLNPAAATGTSVSGNVASVADNPVYSTAITTPTISGDVLNISRAATTNASFASTLTLSGAVAAISDNCTQTTGTCTDTANVLSLTQSYASASGTVLSISDSGTGSAISATGNSIASGTGISGTFNGLTTGIGLSITSSGTITTGGDLVNFVADSATTGQIVNISGAGINTGTGISAAFNGLTTGAGLSLTSSGTITGAGTLATLTANSLTTGTVVNLSATGVTTGTALTITGPSSTGITSGAGIGLVTITGAVGCASSCSGTDNVGGKLLYIAPTFKQGANNVWGVKFNGSDSQTVAATDYNLVSQLNFSGAGSANKTGYGTYTFAADSNTSSGTTTDYGLFSEAQQASTATAGTFNLYGVYGQGDITQLFENANTSTYNMYGVLGTTTALTATNAINTLNMYDFYAKNGSYVSALTTNGSKYGLYLEQQTAANTNWQIYSAGGNSAFGGSTSFGSTTAPSYTVDVTGSERINANSTGNNATVKTLSADFTQTGSTATNVTTTNNQVTLNLGTATLSSSNGPTLCGATTPSWDAHGFQRPDGKFIIVVANATVNTCLYDPVGNSFSTGPSLSAAAGSGATTIPLPNGKFLTILGNSTATTNIYDPGTNTFSAGPSLTTSAGGFIPEWFKRQDGKFIVIPDASATTTNLYDPVANTFAAGPALNTANSGNAGNLLLSLPNGKFLYLIGASSSTNLYDPSTNAFSAGPTIPNSDQPKQGVNAFQRQDGKFIVVLGGGIKTTYIYDPVGNSFSAGPATANNVAHSGHNVQRPDGKFVVFDGCGTTTDIYDPVGNSFSNGTALTNSTGCNGGSFTIQRPDGKYVVFNAGALTTDLVDTGWVTSGSWESEPLSIATLSANATLSWHSNPQNSDNANRVDQTGVYFQARSTTSTCNQTNLNSASYVTVKNSGDLIPLASGATCVQVKAFFNAAVPGNWQEGTDTVVSRNVWIGDGLTSYLRNFPQPTIYDIIINQSIEGRGGGDPAQGKQFAQNGATFENLVTDNTNQVSLVLDRNAITQSSQGGLQISVGPATSAAAGAGAIAFQRPDGRYVIVLGNTSLATSVYDPIANSFSAGATISGATNIAGNGTVVMQRPDSKFVLFKGNGATESSIYDPSADSWSAGPTVPNAVGPGAHAFQRQDGKFVIINGNTSTNTMIYDPVTNGLVAGPALTANAGAGAHTLQLPDGRFLTIVANSTTTNIYDPATNSFVAGPALSATAGSGATSFQRPDGKFFTILGGSGGTNTTSIYDPRSSTFTAGPTLPASTAGSGFENTVLQRPDGKFVIGYQSSISGPFTAIYDPDANTMTSGPSLPNSPHPPIAFQRSDGKYVLIYGNNTTNTSIIDTGWNLAGTYTTEAINNANQTANASLFWKQTGFGTITAKSRTASSANALQTTAWSDVEKNGSQVNTGANAFIQFRFDLNASLADYPGALKHIWPSSDSGGLVVPYRTPLAPTLVSWQLANDTTPSLLTLSNNSVNAFRFNANGQAFTNDGGGWYSGGADIAEYYTAKQQLDLGQLVALDTTSATNTDVTPALASNQGHLVGIVSTKPGFVAGAYTKDGYPIALAGRVPAKVSSSSGVIHKGDYITVSATMPGVGVKATKPGTTVGQAMEDYLAGDSTAVGTIMVFVSVGYVDPTYLNPDNPNPVEIARSLDTMADLPRPIDVASAGGVLKQLALYTDNVAKDGITPQTTVADRLIAPIEVITGQLTANQITTSQINEIPGKTLEVTLAANGQFTIVNQTGQTALTIDEAGNATFSGQLTARSIKADQIEGLQVLTNRIATLEAKQATASATSSALPAIAFDQNAQEATVSGGIAGIATDSATGNPTKVWEISKIGDAIFGSIKTAGSFIADSITGHTLTVTDSATIGNGLKVLSGTAQLPKTVVGGTLTVGTITIDDMLASIDSLSGDLKLQSLTGGGVNFINGKVVIDKSGNVTIASGNVLIEQGVIVGNGQIRGIGVPVTSGVTSYTIAFPAARSSDQYAVSVTPAWLTEVAVTNKTTAGFTVSFSSATPVSAQLDWVVIE